MCGSGGDGCLPFLQMGQHCSGSYTGFTHSGTAQSDTTQCTSLFGSQRHHSQGEGCGQRRDERAIRVRHVSQLKVRLHAFHTGLLEKKTSNTLFRTSALCLHKQNLTSCEVACKTGPRYKDPVLQRSCRLKTNQFTLSLLIFLLFVISSVSSVTLVTDANLSQFSVQFEQFGVIFFFI